MKPTFDPRNPDWNTFLLVGAAYLLVLLGVLTLNPPVGVILFFASALIGAAAGAVYFLKEQLVGKRTAKDESFGARLRSRLQDCQRREDKFRDEANAIRSSIETLRTDLDRSTTAPPEEIARGEKTLAALKAEFELRHTKALFFADCATRLRQLLDRHQLNESIAQRQRDLAALRSTNFDDEAAVEETRYHLEQDSIQLDTLSELSKEMGEYFKKEQAEELRQRLETLRGKILGKPQPGEEQES